MNEQGQNIAKTAITYSSWDNITVGSQTASLLCRWPGCGEYGGGQGYVRALEDMAWPVAALNRCHGWVLAPVRCCPGRCLGIDEDLRYFTGPRRRYDCHPGWLYSREDVDRYAVHVAATCGHAHAEQNGYFKSLVPVVDMNGVTVLDHNDEFIRPGTTLEGLAGQVKPFFQDV